MSTNGDRDLFLRRQSAFVRALADEVERYEAADQRAASALREQLREETARLARDLADAEAPPPPRR